MTKETKPVQRIGPYSKGEIPEPLQVTIKDADGNAVNLTGYSVDFVIEAVDATVTGIGVGTAELQNALNGIVKYTWQAVDFDTEGLYRSQFWVEKSGMRYSSDIFEYFVNVDTAQPF